jgi:hypothetical protein
MYEKNKIWSRVPKGPETKDDCAGEDQEQFTGLVCPTISRRHALFETVSCEMITSKQRLNHESRRISIFGSRYQATTSDDVEDYVQYSTVQWSVTSVDPWKSCSHQYFSVIRA